MAPFACHPIPPHLQELFARPPALSSLVSAKPRSLALASPRSVALPTGTEPEAKSTATPRATKPSPVPVTAPAVGTSDAEKAVGLLSPSKTLLSNLTAFQSSYSSASHALDALLSYPNLQALKIDQPAGGSGPTNIRDLVLRGRNDFQLFADLEVQNCRNLQGYSSWLGTVAALVPISDIGTGGAFMMKGFAEQVRDQTKLKTELFYKLSTLVDKLQSTIGDVTSQIDSLASSIAVMDKKLANDTVYAKLRKILAAIYALAQVDTDAKTQISVILGVSLDLLTTPLKSLYANPSKQEQIVHSLKLAKTKFERLAQLLSQLAVSTQGTVKAANVIMNIWESVQSGLEALSSTTRTLNEKEAATVSTAWASASSTLAKIIDILTGAIQLSSSINLAKANTNDFGEDVIPIPQDKNTLTFLRALHNTEAQKILTDPRRFTAVRKLATNHVFQKAVNKKVRGMLTTSHGNDDRVQARSLAENTDDFQMPPDFDKYFQPPPDMQQAIDKLAGSCSVIKDKFSVLLAVPYLNQLNVLNPMKKDAQESIDLRTMTLQFQAMYNALQDKTVGVVRDLLAYSVYQVTVLPMVAVTPTEGQIGLDDWLTANTALISNFTKAATDLSQNYTDFLRDWDLARISITKSIAECEETIKRNQALLEEKKKEQTNDSLLGWLKVIGAVACFAAAAFIPGVGILVLGAGIGLLVWGIGDLVKAGKLDDAIAEYESIIQTATTSKNQLQLLVEPMKNVTDSVQRVSACISNLATTMTTINNAFIPPWKMAKLVPSIFNKTVGKVTELWHDAATDCQQYISFISQG